MTLHRSFAILRFFILTCGIACALSVQAQTMYRCANVYQDRPCDSATPSQIVRGGSSVGASKSPASPPTTPVMVDSSCAKRGAATQSIVWAREGGKTAAEQTAQTNSAEQKKLIADVYALRASAPQVREMIEAQCIADKEKAAQAAALAAAAAKLLGQANSGSTGPSTPATPIPTSSNTETPNGDQRQAEVKRGTAEKNLQCESVKRQISAIASEQRAGGSISRMEQLNRQKQEADKKASSLQC